MTVAVEPSLTAAPVRSGGACEAKTIVKPVANAVAILKFLGDTGAPATATQLARKLQINTSTCFNILRTLVNEGVVDFDPQAKTYQVGMGLVKFVRQALDGAQQLSNATLHLQELAETFGVTTTLWRRMSLERMVLIALESSSADLRIHLRSGLRLPTLLGSTGRSIAARLDRPKSAIRAEFNKLRWTQPFAFQDYWAEAEAAAQRGWAIDDGIFAAGVLTLSTPLSHPNGGLSPYSLTIVTFRGRHSPAEIEQMGGALMRFARQLSSVLH